MTFPWPTPHDDPGFEFEKDVEVKFDAYIDLDFDTDNTYYSDAYVSYCIDPDIELHENSVFFNIDVEAVGDNTAVETNLSVLTTDDLSSLVLTGFAITD
jgi:hypothetical protein